MMSLKTRSKSWQEKVKIVQNCYSRARLNPSFANKFYKKLFFLNPAIEKHFKETNFDHQEKALIHGLDIIFQYFDDNENGRIQISRLSKLHNVDGLKVHPHLYYYWIEALIMTIKSFDKMWYDEQEYYIREVVNYPISFFTSQYFLK